VAAMNFKKKEIKQYFDDFIKENQHRYFVNDLDFIKDLHYHCFNTDYYIIGTYKATQWIGGRAFEVINFIKDYEMDNFGEVITDFSAPEKVVNMYVYIIGEDIVNDFIEDLHHRW